MNLHPRFPIKFLFVLSSLLVGLFTGTWIGAQFFVPEGSGLAGPFIALGYGIVGAVIGLGIGLLLAIRLPRNWLATLAIPVILAAAIGSFITIDAFLDSQREQKAQLDQLVAALPPVSLALEYQIPDADLPLLAFDYETASERFNAVRGDGSACSGKIPSNSNARVALVAALRHLEILQAQNPDLCSEDGEAVYLKLAFEIIEAKPPNSSGSLKVTPGCLKRHKEIYDIASGIEKVYIEYKDSCL